ncbi:MAG: phage tail protein [Gammaproteobacteria bacterium]|uniref:phage tail protein n=1 Tax=Pseudomaricurvus alcaniphilus TaxID=1166482 RepID=UPI001408CAEB|nr:phage tail protein [Pseudomaricurvus alcaniphilus]MBR9909387.1 phage tail protein [Gammaproteobacteria bacterium]NHN38324.1 phage tail protein [Pseudomaricurvus alcaniphilus]
MAETDRLLSTFQFSVKLRKSAQIAAGGNLDDIAVSDSGQEALGDGGFQECSGLEVSMDVQDYNEGGRNDGVIRRVGRAKYSNIVLKRGMFFSVGSGVQRELWEWLQNIVAGRRPVARYDGIIEVKSRSRDTVATWVFERGLPLKISGPQLNAKTGDIAIEEIHIAPETLRLVTN